jgi:hypothetical protein
MRGEAGLREERILGVFSFEAKLKFSVIWTVNETKNLVSFAFSNDIKFKFSVVHCLKDNKF